MANKPIEWRRFEPVELAGPRERIVWQPTDPRGTDTVSVLREFERILRENERLRIESSSVRVDVPRPSNGHGNGNSHGNSAGNGNGHGNGARERDKRLARVQEDLEAARNQVTQLQAEMSALQHPHVVPFRPAPDSPAAANAGAPTESNASTARKAAEVVASYLFDDPSEPQIRLVEDALRSRGLDNAR